MEEQIKKLFSVQFRFQKFVGFPIDSILEQDRNEMSEKYIFKMIEEAIELRREFPSVMNPWSKHQKGADLDRIKQELSDVFLFFSNLLLVWKIPFDEFVEYVFEVQKKNFLKIKTRKMELLNQEILSIPGHMCGIGSGNLNPKYVFVGQNPGTSLPYHGYPCWSEEKVSGSILLPALKSLKLFDISYFTNIVKSTTPDNSEPDSKSVDFWFEFLLREIDILNTENSIRIISMGNWSTSQLNNRGISSTQISHPSYYLRLKKTPKDYEQELHKANLI